MNTFEVPRWVMVLGSRLYLRNLPVAQQLEPSLSDDDAVALAMAVAADLNCDETFHEKTGN